MEMSTAAELRHFKTPDLRKRRLPKRGVLGPMDNEKAEKGAVEERLRTEQDDPDSVFGLRAVRLHLAAALWNLNLHGCVENTWSRWPHGARVSRWVSMLSDKRFERPCTAIQPTIKTWAESLPDLGITWKEDYIYFSSSEGKRVVGRRWSALALSCLLWLVLGTCIPV
jgi:hypothetical protein